MCLSTFFIIISLLSVFSIILAVFSDFRSSFPAFLGKHQFELSLSLSRCPSRFSCLLVYFISGQIYIFFLWIVQSFIEPFEPNKQNKTQHHQSPFSLARPNEEDRSMPKYSNIMKPDRVLPTKRAIHSSNNKVLERERQQFSFSTLFHLLRSLCALRF